MEDFIKRTKKWLNPLEVFCLCYEKVLSAADPLGEKFHWSQPSNIRHQAPGFFIYPFCMIDSIKRFIASIVSIHKHFFRIVKSFFTFHDFFQGARIHSRFYGGDLSWWAGPSGSCKYVAVHIFVLEFFEVLK